MSKHLENLAELNIGLLRDISVGVWSYSLIRDHIHSIVLLLGSDENTFVNLCGDIKEGISNYSEINIKLTLREAHFLLAAIKENQDYYIKEHGLEQVKDKLEEALK